MRCHDSLTRCLIAVSALAWIFATACDDDPPKKNLDLSELPPNDVIDEETVNPTELFVSAISPIAGPVAGGTVVTIHGRNFINGATVHFGDNPGANVRLIGATQLEATSPAATGPGKVAIIVTNPSGESVTKADAFEYRAAVAEEVDWCKLHWPASTRVAPGQSTEPIFGRIWEGGCTDGGQQCATVLGELGWGPTSVNPETNPTGFTWTGASYNPAHTDDDEDEYMATITPSAEGSYAYVYRFSVNGGNSWTYCDLGGSADGFQADQMGQLTVATDVTSVGWCSLHWPPSTNAAPGAETEMIFGRVFAQDCTEGEQQCQQIIGDLGYGPQGVNAAAEPNAFQWKRANLNPAHTADNNDEHMASLTVASPGTYAYAYRFSADNGQSWMYCDLDGSDNGFQPESAGTLNVAEDTLHVMWCNLQYPPSTATGVSEDTEAIFGRVYVPGCTEGEQTCAAVRAQLGHGPQGRNPQVQPDIFDWRDATFNAREEEDNNSEYVSNLNINTNGTYAYAYRFSVDNGQSWTYCDLDGSDNGVQLTELGVVEVGDPVTPGVSWCRLQGPLQTSTVKTVATTPIYAQVLVDGCTGGGTQCPRVQAEIGFGPDTADPSTDPSTYTWTAATYNAAHTTSANDEYSGILVPTADGDYRYAFRFAVDDSGEWTYCDSNPDTAFSVDETGTLSVADKTVGWCIFQYPTQDKDPENLTAVAGAESVPFFGRVYVENCSENGTYCPGILAQLGYGPDNEDPRDDTTGVFTWAAANYNTGHTSDNNNEYARTLTIATTGIYALVYRFSGDGGATWIYCDPDDNGLFDPTRMVPFTVTD